MGALREKRLEAPRLERRTEYLAIGVRKRAWPADMKRKGRRWKDV